MNSRILCIGRLPQRKRIALYVKDVHEGIYPIAWFVSEDASLEFAEFVTVKDYDAMKDLVK